jgi:hypothetical protein
MRSLHTLIFVAATILSLPAQDPPETPTVAPVFDGKIQLRAPERSAWEVTLRPTAAMRIEQRQQARVASVEELPAKPAAGDDSLVRLRVEKSGELFHETSFLANGKKTEKWGIGAIQFREMEGRDILAMAGMNLLDSDFSDHSKEDFEELGWLTKDSYVGTIYYQKQACFLFQTTSDKRPHTRRESAVDRFMSDSTTDSDAAKPTAPPPAPTPVTVIVSAATRLPVLYNDGKLLRTYKFDPGPFSPLVPPPLFAREFNAWRAHLAESTRAPSAP